jgi:hypothetical protein
MRKTTDQEQEVLEFLNMLRDSGATNMFGAVPYIKDEFELDSKESKVYLCCGWLISMMKVNTTK